MRYDYLIVGSGIFGSVFAHEAANAGKKCLVIEKNQHIGGLAYTREVGGIDVHEYGPHIFHTSNADTWKYINQFAQFNNFINSPLAYCEGKIYNLPFNMNTFYKLWGVITPQQAREKINEQKQASGIKEPANLEEQAIKLVGLDIYKKFIHGYTKKQWGKEPKDLPAFIIKRIPVRFTYNNNYFNDRYQGIPEGGYTKIIEKLLNRIEVRVGEDFIKKREFYEKTADKIVFTGMIDKFFGNKFGPLEYRSLKFEHQTLDNENYQGNAVINYTQEEIPYTRIIEHKHFDIGNESKKTVITKEYPVGFSPELTPYYPINDQKNNNLYKKYFELAKTKKNIIFGGRLAEYKYYNMDEVIEKALQTARLELRK